MNYFKILLALLCTAPLLGAGVRYAGVSIGEPNTPPVVDDFVALWTFDAEVNPAEDCTAEDGITFLTLADGDTVNCDQTVVVSEGSEALEWGDPIDGIGSNSTILYAEDAFVGSFTGTDVMQVRIAHRHGANDGSFNTRPFMRTRNGSVAEGFQYRYDSNSSQFQVSCNDFDTERSAFTVAVDQWYHSTITYDIGSDIANVWIKTDGTFGTEGDPDLSCAGSGTPVTNITGLQLQPAATLGTFIDDVQVGLNTTGGGVTPVVHILDGTIPESVAQLALEIGRSDMEWNATELAWETNCTVAETAFDTGVNPETDGDGCYGGSDPRTGWGWSWSPATQLVKGQTLIVEFDYKKPLGQPYAPDYSSSPDGSTKFFRIETRGDNPAWVDDGSQTDPDISGEPRYRNEGFFDFKEAYTDVDYPSPTGNAYGYRLNGPGYGWEPDTRFLFTKEDVGAGPTISNWLTSAEMATGTWYQLRIEIDLSDVVSEAEARAWITTDGNFDVPPTMVTDGTMPTLTNASDTVPRILVRSYFNNLAAADMTQYFRNMTWSAITTPPVASADYRTIVTFGDLQYFTNGTDAVDAGGRYNDFADQVDWVIANKAAENIEFVTMVGDLIDTGTNLPLSSACDVGTWTTSYPPYSASCSVHDGDATACNAEDGCGVGTRSGGTGCESCEMVPTAEAEWVRFITQLDRLTAAGIPTLTVKGNHDNLGLQFATNAGREPSGYDASRLDTAYWDALDTGTFTDRSYEHIAENDLGADGIGHAWTAALDTTPVLVVALPYVSQTGIDAAHITWLTAQCEAHPTKPVFLLAHHRAEVTTTVVAAMDTVCPNLVSTFSGHVGWPSPSNGNRSLIRSAGGGDNVVSIEVDYTNTLEAVALPSTGGGSAQRDSGNVLRDDYIGITRFNLTADTVEHDLYSVQGVAFVNDTVALGADTQFAATSFDITAPVPYDLSGIEPEMVLAFDDRGSARPAWPDPPTAENACAATNDATLASCLSVGNRHISVSAGTYTSSYTIGQDDIWLEMDNASIITGGFNVAGTVNRFKMTGGIVRGPHSVNLNAGYTDVLIDNVNFDLHYVDATRGGTMDICTGLTGTSSRLAIVNTTIHSSRWSLLSDHGCRHEDVILANVDAWSDYIVGDPGNDEGVHRLMNTIRVLSVDSHYRISPTSKATIRMHYANDFTLWVDNVVDQAEGWGGVWIDTDSGTGEDQDIADTFFIRNHFYQAMAGNVTDMVIDDSAPGNGIDVTYVYIHDNVAHHATDTTFGYSQPAATTFDVGGNSKLADFTAFLPMSGGANH